MNFSVVSSVVVLSLLASTAAFAADPATPMERGARSITSVDDTAGSPAPIVVDTFSPPEPAVPSGKPAREPYAGPIQLRGVNTGNSIKTDTTVAPFTDPRTKDGQIETISFVSASARLSDRFGLTTRIGAVRNDHAAASGGGRDSTTGLTNLGVGGIFAQPLGPFFRFAANAGVSVPTAAGGGNTPSATMAATMKAASYARGSMDNSSFAPNDLGFSAGADLAFTRRQLTVQAEVTAIPSVRVQGEQKQVDKSKLNATSGLFVGYFVIPRRLSLGAEGHYQRYLSTPDAVAKDSSLRDNLTAGGGVRGYFDVSDDVKVRPRVSYFEGISGPSADRGYHMVQVDMAVQF